MRCRPHAEFLGVTLSPVPPLSMGSLGLCFRVGSLFFCTTVSTRPAPACVASPMRIFLSCGGGGATAAKEVPNVVQAANISLACMPKYGPKPLNLYVMYIMGNSHAALYLPVEDRVDCSCACVHSARDRLEGTVPVSR